MPASTKAAYNWRQYSDEKRKISFIVWVCFQVSKHSTQPNQRFQASHIGNIQDANEVIVDIYVKFIFFFFQDLVWKALLHPITRKVL